MIDVLVALRSSSNRRVTIMSLKSFNKIHLVAAMSIAFTSQASTSDVLINENQYLSKEGVDSSPSNSVLNAKADSALTKAKSIIHLQFPLDEDEEHDDEGEHDEEDDHGDGEEDDHDDDHDEEDDNDDEDDGHGGDHDDNDDGHDDDHGSGGEQPGHNHCMMTPEFAELSLATHSAVQSGKWSDQDTWGGVIPNNDAIVHIPQDMEVTINQAIDARIETVRIDGSLSFNPDVDTQLNVDTLYSSCTGTLQIGAEAQPINADVSARVVFIDDGPITDSKLLSRGAVLQGQTVMHGAAKTHRVTLAAFANAGDTRLHFNETPVGWKIGDEIVVTGTTPNDPRSDEIRRISQINGSYVDLNEPLALDHVAPKTSLNVYVANTTRNIEFVSENTEVSRRGHIMFMHTQKVNVQNARFTELGRTDKRKPLEDFQFTFGDDSAGDDAPATAEVTALGGTNVRGRYAVHFHQTGTDPSSEPAYVKGSVVFNGPGWGYVIHSSYANLVDNISYGLQGAGFYTEAGDEIGSLVGNIAIRSVNDSFVIDDQGAIDPDLRADLMDYGHDGDGFWLTGTRVSLIDNVAAGASAHGIIYWTDGIMEAKLPRATRVTVLVSSLPNGELIPNRESVPVWWAPLAENRGNESYIATVGFRSRYIHSKNYLGRDEQSEFHRSPPQAYIDTLNPVFNDITVWGSRDGILLNYNEKVSINGANIVGFGKEISVFELNPGTAKEGLGLDFSNDATHGPGNIENVHIEGFGVGLAAPVNGQWQVKNLTLSENKHDVLVLTPESDSTQVLFNNVSFNSVINEEQQVIDLPEHIIIEQ